MRLPYAFERSRLRHCLRYPVSVVLIAWLPTLHKMLPLLYAGVAHVIYRIRSDRATHLEVRIAGKPRSLMSIPLSHASRRRAGRDDPLLDAQSSVGSAARIFSGRRRPLYRHHPVFESSPRSRPSAWGSSGGSVRRKACGKRAPIPGQLRLDEMRYRPASRRGRASPRRPAATYGPSRAFRAATSFERHKPSESSSRRPVSARESVSAPVRKL